MGTRRRESQHPHPGEEMPLRRLLRVYLIEAKYESLRMLRSPAFTISFLGAPVLLYLFFWLFVARSRGQPSQAVAAFTLVSWSVYGMVGPGLYGFGVAIAMEREQGLLTLRRALPAPLSAYLLGKLLMVLLYGMVVLVMLVPTASCFGNPGLGPWQYVALASVDILGALPFCALGLLIGTRFSGRAAPGIANLVFLPTLLLGGLFIPLPSSVAWAMYLSPAYYLDQLALRSVGLPAQDPAPLHVTVLTLFTVALTLSSLKRLARAG